VLGETHCRKLVERSLAASRADETEVVLITASSALTRFANSAIHQNVNEDNAELRARVVLGKRIGVASTNDLSADGLEDVLARAAAIAERQREDPNFPGLAEPRPVAQVDSYDAATAECSPDARARGAKVICDLALESGLLASGAYKTEAGELAVGNSLGLWAYANSTNADLKTVVTASPTGSAPDWGEDAAGYAERVSVRVDEIDCETAGREAVDKALRGRGAVRADPGEYEVLLEEYAVGEALKYLSYMGFGALALQEGHSFLAGRLGEQVVSEKISIWDDGSDRRGLPAAFDFEGVPKRRVKIIDQGVAQGVVHDCRSGSREGVESTGHGLPAPNTFGPFAWNVVMAPGDSSKERMVAKVERGLWVTRFHYVNVLHPRRATLTGMTRDGTFLIENGEVGPPVYNLRFTQNMLEALSEVKAVGAELVAVGGFLGANVVPALHIGRFNFTGSTPSSA
jgi:PmbA protein